MSVIGALTITRNKLAAGQLALDVLTNVTGCVDVEFDVDTCSNQSQLGATEVSCCDIGGTPTLASVAGAPDCATTCP